MNQASDFVVKISRGSTLAQVEERLRATRSVEFLVTCNFDILLHHADTHTILLDDCGIAACDLVVIGNLSLGIGLFEYKGRSACVRFKSSEATGEFCRAADAAIDAFLKPLAVATRLAQAALPEAA
jgi:hypothetical protein